MEIKSDIDCKGSIWYRVAHEYGYNEDAKFFDTFWGEFKTCLAIGILYDKQIDDADLSDDDEKVSVPRTMFNRHSSEMDLFFQSAILTSNCVKLSEKDRLYLAFSSEISEDELDDSEIKEMQQGVSEEALNFDKIRFLKRFANYGATKMADCLNENDSVTMEKLAEFLMASYNGETEELLELTKVEDLIDDI